LRSAKIIASGTLFLRGFRAVSYIRPRAVPTEVA
jgi:hypothetical protein